MADSIFANFYVGWEALAILAAAGSVIISIMLIMLSRLFDQRQLEETAKKEFIFAASSVFIVIFAIGLVNLSDGLLLNSVAKPLYWASVSYCPNMDLEVCKKIAAVQATSIPADTMIDIMLLYMEAPMDCIQKFLDFLYQLFLEKKPIFIIVCN